jgi:hypothetical protein
MEEMTVEEYRRKYAKKRAGKSSRPSTDWTAVLIQQIELLNLPAPEREYVFHSERKWRFDLSWKKHGRLVACEIEGGIWMKTEDGYSKGHAHPKRFMDDCEKYNEAAIYGWAVIRVTPEMIRDGRAVAWLERVLVD